MAGASLAACPCNPSGSMLSEATWAPAWLGSMVVQLTVCAVGTPSFTPVAAAPYRLRHCVGPSHAML